MSDRSRLTCKMDADLFLITDSWLEDIAALEHHGTPEELLDELLSDWSEDSQHSTRNTEPTDVSEHHKKELKAVKKPTSEPLDANAQHQMALKTVPRQARPRHEIARLKKTVINLETMLALLHRRQDTVQATRTKEQPGVGADRSDAVAMDAWKGVAIRQQEKLRDSTVENRVLRSQVEAQDAIICSLERLADRARVSLLTPSRPSDLPDVSTLAFATKRAELVDRVEHAFNAVDRIVTDEHFTAQPNAFRSVFVSNSRQLNPGHVMVESYARQVVPLPMSQVGEYVWSRSSASHTSPSSFVLCHEVVESPQQQILVYSMALPSSNGSDYMPVMALRSRRLLDGRDAVVTVVSPLVTSSIEIAIHVVTQPYIGSTRRQISISGISEVLVRMESCQGASPVSPRESLRFRELAVAMHTTVHSDIQTRIDDALLQSNK